MATGRPQAAPTLALFPSFLWVRLFMPWFVTAKAHDGSGIIAAITISSSTMFLGISRLGGTSWLGFTVMTIGGSQRIGIESC